MENMSDKKNNIIKTIQNMSGKFSVYEIFADWVELMALAMANQIIFDQKREERYTKVLERYTKPEQDKLFEMTAWLIEWADAEYFDMLGFIYMHLELGSKRGGQFFTPYHLCRMMANLVTFDDEIRVANEPTCGAGGNIIALAEAMRLKGVNYQEKLLAICQDIDIKAVYMAYVQLSLYGVPAVVYQSDTLRDPNGLDSSTGYLYTFGYVMHPKLQDEWRRKNGKENNLAKGDSG